MCMNVALARRCLEERPLWWWSLRTAQDEPSSTGKQARFSVTRELVHLIWQNWTQLRLLLRIIIPLYVLATVGLLFVVITSSDGFVLAFHTFVSLSTIAGICMFLPDQVGNRRQFLAERGISPGRIWWSRQLLWLPLLAFAPLSPCSLGSAPVKMFRRNLAESPACWCRWADRPLLWVKLSRCISDRQ